MTNPARRRRADVTRGIQSTPHRTCKLGERLRILAVLVENTPIRQSSFIAEETEVQCEFWPPLLRAGRVSRQDKKMRWLGTLPNEPEEKCKFEECTLI